MKQAQSPTQRRLSRLHQPPEMTLEAWQQQLRKQFGSEQPFLLENLGDHPFFSDFRVTNPARGSVYRVAIRGLNPGPNFCSCADFKTNTLGTCKHIEFTLSRLLARRGAKRAFLAGYDPAYSSISIEYGPQRHVRFRMGRDCISSLRRLVQRHFDDSGRLTDAGFALFDRFLAKAKELDPNLRVYDDVLMFVAEVRDARSRAVKIDEAFPAGIRGPQFDHLLAGRARLYGYQREGVLFAARAGRCLIGDEMGLGKTIQAIATAEIMARPLGVERVLVVCPTSLKHQWEQEIARFCKRPARVIHGLRRARAEAWEAAGDFFKITNFDTVHADLDAIARWAPDLVILDEAQRIKNWSTRTARSVKQISSPYAIVLTGTPLENRLEELISIVEFVDPFRLGPTFRLLDTHQVRDENGRVVGYRDLDRLAKTLDAVLIRRRKKEVLAQLPERLEKNFFVAMRPEQIALHEENREVVGRIVAKWKRHHHLSESDQRRLMIALQNMRMSCDSSYLLDERSDHGTKAGEIVTLLGEVLEEQQAKVVVFSQWLRMHEILQRRIAPLGCDHVLFHGGVDARARARLVDRFRDDPRCRVFLSTDAGGVGLNLQHASVVINVDLPWNPAVLEQRIGRVHRLGQRNPVRIVNFVAEGTIEQGMLNVLRFKKSLFAGVLDGGEKEVFLGEGRLSQFMRSIESVSKAMPPVPPTAEQAPTDRDGTQGSPADAGADHGRAATEVPESAGDRTGEPAAPWISLIESGMGFLQQLAAALPASALPNESAASPTAEPNGQSRRIEARKDADGSMFLAVPMPSREAVARFTEGLTALLRSLQS